MLNLDLDLNITKRELSKITELEIINLDSFCKKETQIATKNNNEEIANKAYKDLITFLNHIRSKEYSYFRENSKRKMRVTIEILKKKIKNFNEKLTLLTKNQLDLELFPLAQQTKLTNKISEHDFKINNLEPEKLKIIKTNLLIKTFF